MKKVALVTGGSRGIGKEICLNLSSRNHHVIVGFNNSFEDAKALVEKINKGSGSAEYVEIDVSNKYSIHQAFELIPSVDILINNAGITDKKDFLKITDKDLERVIRVNFTGAFICSQLVIPGMLKKKWGRIINISSIGGQWGGVDQVHYACSKSALIGLSRSLSRLYSKFGITSNSVSPGVIDTEMINDIDINTRNEILNLIPSNRFGSTRDIANIVSFLASDESSYITGQTINLNGGMLRS